MLMSRALSRASRSLGRRSLRLLSSSPSPPKQQFLLLADQFQPLLRQLPNEFIPGQVSLFHHSALNCSPFQRFGFSSASPETSEKEQGSTAENTETEKTNGDEKLSSQSKDSDSQPSLSQKRRERGTKRTAFSDSDSEAEVELEADDLAKLVAEKDELLKAKHKEIEALKDKVLRSFAEMENVMERTKREAENSKKFAIQNFAKSLLDVADNLGRASSVVKASFSKIDASADTTGSASLLKTLLEGVEMTEKQLAEVFKKYGVEKYDPTNEPFDPHRHNAVFQIPDASKPPGTVAAVLKAGYILYDRVIRPAEVGVTAAVENDAEAKNDDKATDT
ncbi:hypothetical protein Tsubulata_043056 [Turnera subulata]|uniref:GrpE protein homolog n=1 Tax=Turnera subulata TaxID=218843 RepID=A0A9Q0JPK1_9ROSI|nr:hypothetical protein Tsubulata_043056 [Turnera subulata]